MLLLSVRRVLIGGGRAPHAPLAAVVLARPRRGKSLEHGRHGGHERGVARAGADRLLGPVPRVLLPDARVLHVHGDHRELAGPVEHGRGGAVRGRRRGEVPGAEERLGVPQGRGPQLRACGPSGRLARGRVVRPLPYLQHLEAHPLSRLELQQVRQDRPRDLARFDARHGLVEHLLLHVRGLVVRVPAVQQHVEQYAEAPEIDAEVVGALLQHLRRDVPLGAHHGLRLAEAIAHRLGQPEVSDLDLVQHMWPVLLF
mmetsp:Transcript_92158/g.260862  ORF Transcript_92158/g.260862 Transcript_92158/m.260862 type:complete len:256 (+) Transcript_92158:187-954(+)